MVKRKRLLDELFAGLLETTGETRKRTKRKER
jgi:hypothetical protein